MLLKLPLWDSAENFLLTWPHCLPSRLFRRFCGNGNISHPFTGCHRDRLLRDLVCLLCASLVINWLDFWRFLIQRAHSPEVLARCQAAFRTPNKSQQKINYMRGNQSEMPWYSSEERQKQCQKWPQQRLPEDGDNIKWRLRRYSVCLKIATI